MKQVLVLVPACFLAPSERRRKRLSVPPDQISFNSIDRRRNSGQNPFHGYYTDYTYLPRTLTISSLLYHNRNRKREKHIFSFQLRNNGQKTICSMTTGKRNNNRSMDGWIALKKQMMGKSKFPKAISFT